MRILAVDWGTVRVGLAISDELQTMAFPLERTVESSQALAEIKGIVAADGVEKIVIGLPKNLEGQEGASAAKAREFAQALEPLVSGGVEFLDERFSSVAAGQMLAMQGVKAKDQRGIKDNIAAQVMLQQYLETQQNNN